jgi:hypothetical protein
MMTTATTRQDVLDLDDSVQAKRQGGKLYCPGTIICDAHVVRDEADNPMVIVDAAYLQLLADATNAFVSKAGPCPICYGHTRDDTRNEADNPPKIGAASNFVVGEDDDGTPVIGADLVFDGSELDKLGLKGTHPLSIEMWLSPNPEELLIWPISVLNPATAPERPMKVQLQRQRNGKRTQLHGGAFSNLGGHVSEPEQTHGGRFSTIGGKIAEREQEHASGYLSEIGGPVSGRERRQPEREARDWGTSYVRPGDTTASFLRAKQLRQQVEAEQRRREQEEQQAGQQRPERYEADDEYLDQEERSSVIPHDYYDDTRAAGERIHGLQRDYLAGRPLSPQAPPESAADRADRATLEGQARRRPVRHAKDDLTLSGDSEMQNQNEDIVARILAALENSAPMKFLQNLMRESEAEHDSQYADLGDDGDSMQSLGDSEEYVEDDGYGYEGAQPRRYAKGSVPSGSNTFQSTYQPPTRKALLGSGNFGRHPAGGNGTRRMPTEDRNNFTQSIAPPAEYGEEMDDLVENKGRPLTDSAIPQPYDVPEQDEIREAYKTTPQAIPKPGDYSEEDADGVSRGEMWEAIDAANGDSEDFARRIKKLKEPSMRPGQPRRYARCPVAAAAASAGIDGKAIMWAAVSDAMASSDTVAGQRAAYRELASQMQPAAPTPRRVRYSRTPALPAPMTKAQMYAAVKQAQQAGDKVAATDAYRQIVG